MNVEQQVIVTISRKEAIELLASTAPAPYPGTALAIFRAFLTGLVGE